MYFHNRLNQTMKIDFVDRTYFSINKKYCTLGQLKTKKKDYKTQKFILVCLND